MVFGRNNFTPFSFKAHKKARYLYFVWHMAMCVCLGIWWWNGSTGFGFEILCNFLLLLHSTYFRLNIIASQTIIMKESFFQLKQMRVKHQMPTQTQSPHTKSYTFDETASVTLNARKRKNEWGGGNKSALNNASNLRKKRHTISPLAWRKMMSFYFITILLSSFLLVVSYFPSPAPPEQMQKDGSASWPSGERNEHREREREGAKKICWQ